MPIITLKNIYLLLTLSLMSPVLQAQVSPSTFEDLVHQRRWNELRMAAAQDSNAGFYRAVAAAVFNDPEAESLFKQVIQAEPSSEHVYDVYNWLANIYQSLAVTIASLSSAKHVEAFPDKKAIDSQKQEDAPYMNLPDQENGSRIPSTFHHDGHSLPAPATINGRHVEFFFDNGSDLSCISEDEAKRLGMTSPNSVGALWTMTESVGFHMATAKDVTIGGMHFRNVSFAVFPDNRPPMSLVSMDIAGLLPATMVSYFRWVECTLKSGIARFCANAQSHLRDMGHHVVHPTFQRETIWTSFDSGATTTDIYAPFARRFPDYLQQHGKTGNNQIIGLGGSENYEAIDVPELLLQIDGKNLTLRPAHIMTKRQDIAIGYLPMSGKICTCKRQASRWIFKQ